MNSMKKVTIESLDRYARTRKPLIEAPSKEDEEELNNLMRCFNVTSNGELNLSDEELRELELDEEELDGFSMEVT